MQYMCAPFLLALSIALHSKPTVTVRSRIVHLCCHIGFIADAQGKGARMRSRARRRSCGPLAPFIRPSTYPPQYLPTSVHTRLGTHPPRYPPAEVPTRRGTYPPRYLPTKVPTCLGTYPPRYTPTLAPPRAGGPCRHCLWKLLLLCRCLLS